MRILALFLLLASATAYADGQTVKLVTELKGNPKVEAAMKAEAEKHRDKLETAAAGKPFEIRISATLERKGEDTKCKLSAQVYAGKTILGMATGGATVKGADETVSATDCVEAVIGDLLDKKVTQTMAGSAAGSGSAKKP